MDQVQVLFENRPASVGPNQTFGDYRVRARIGRNRAARELATHTGPHSRPSGTANPQTPADPTGCTATRNRQNRGIKLFLKIVFC